MPITVRPALVASIALEAPTTELEEGERLQCTATPRDRRGRALAHAVVSWRSDAPHVATVDDSGVVQTREAGHATIRATAEGRRATVALHVRPAAVATLEIVAPALTLRVGERARLAAVARDRRGVVRDRPVRWISRNPDVLAVGPDGQAEARAMGSAGVEAECEGVKASAELWVVVASVTALFAAPAPAAPAPAVAVPVAPAEVEVVLPTTAEQPAAEQPAPTAEVRALPIPDEAPGPELEPRRPRPGVAERPPAVPAPARLVAVAEETQPVEPVARPRSIAQASEDPRATAPSVEVPRPGAPSRTAPSRGSLAVGAGVAALLALGAWWTMQERPTSPATDPGAATATPTPQAGAPAPPAAPPSVSVPPPTDVVPKSPPAASSTPERSEPRIAVPVTPSTSPDRSVRRTTPERADSEAANRRTASVVAAPTPSTTPEITPAAPPTRVTTVPLPPTTSAPPTREPVPSAAEASAAAAAAAAAEARTGMQRAVSAYVAAIGARNVGDLQRAFPTMPENVRRGWESLFTATRSIEARTEAVQVTPSGGDAGTADFTLSVSFENPVSKRPCQQIAQLRARLARAGGPWRITALEQLDNSSSAGCRR